MYRREQTVIGGEEQLNQGNPPSLFSSPLSKMALLGGAAAAALILAYMSVYIIKSKENGVLTSFGEVEDVLKPGIGLKWPWKSVTDYDVSVQNIRVIQQRPPKGGQQKTDEINNTTYTRDQQAIYATVTAQIYLESGKPLMDIHSKFPSWKVTVETKLSQAMKEVLGRYSTTEIPNRRKEIAKEIEESFARQIDEVERDGVKMPIKVNTAQLDNFDFSWEYEERVEAAASAKTDLTKRETQEQTARVSKRITILDAEAQSEKTKVTADAEAYALFQKAKAEAEGIKMKQEALKQSPLLIELVKAQQWDGRLPQNIFAGAPIPYFDASHTLAAPVVPPAATKSDKPGAPAPQ